jgi:di/tricarboxylate transporter
MFEFTRLGIVFLIVGLVYTLTFARRLLPSRSVVTSLTRKYHMGPYLTELRVVKGSKIMGKTCREVGVNERYDVTALAIVRDGERHVEDIRDLALRPDDILIVRGEFHNIMRLRNDHGVALLPDVKLSDAELSAGGQMIAEALVAPSSSLVDKTLKERFSPAPRRLRAGDPPARRHSPGQDC